VREERMREGLYKRGERENWEEGGRVSERGFI